MKTSYIINSIKGVFKVPKKKYYFGKIRHGNPYFLYPWNLLPFILDFRKEPPKFRRTKYYKVLNFYIGIGWPVMICKSELGWKDKYNTPRFEWCPFWYLYIFNYQFCIWWIHPVGDHPDRYWEQIIWYIIYSGKDIDEARNTWGWRDSEGNSTWDETFLEQATLK